MAQENPDIQSNEIDRLNVLQRDQERVISYHKDVINLRLEEIRQLKEAMEKDLHKIMTMEENLLIERNKVRELRILIAENEDRLMCVICRTNEKKWCMESCGHLLYCDDCFDKMQKKAETFFNEENKSRLQILRSFDGCPICRSTKGHFNGLILFSKIYY